MAKVEYLVTIDSTNGTGSSKESLIKIIDASNDLSVEGDYLVFEEEKFYMKLELNKVENSPFCVYCVLLESESSKLQRALRPLRRELSRVAEGKFQELRNDFSEDWATKMYPLVFSVENRMRALISKFMTNNLGPDWYVGTVPKSVKDSRIKDPKLLKTVEVLYHIDFIHLSNFLLKPYSNYPIDNFTAKLPKLLNNISRMENYEIEEELEKFKEVNNWDRYFKAVFKIDSSKLESLWHDAYDYRCKVAHSQLITEHEYERGVKLFNELEAILDDAILAVNKIQVPESEKDILEYENISSAHPEAELIVEDLKQVRNDIIKALNPPRISGTVPHSTLRIQEVLANMQLIDSPIRKMAETLKKHQDSIAIATSIASISAPLIANLALQTNAFKIFSDNYFSSQHQKNGGLYILGGSENDSIDEEE